MENNKEGKLIWPPENTFKYIFDKKLEMAIPVKDGGIIKEEDREI